MDPGTAPVASGGDDSCLVAIDGDEMGSWLEGRDFPDGPSDQVVVGLWKRWLNSSILAYLAVSSGDEHTDSEWVGLGVVGEFDPVVVDFYESLVGAILKLWQCWSSTVVPP